MLDNQEQGIYRNLLDECWVAGSITSDPQLLARFVKEPIDYFAQVWAKLRRKFKPIENGERLISPRLEQDRRRLMLNAKFNEKRAKKAANVRWAKDRIEKDIHASSTVVASVEHAVEQCHSQSQSQSPIHSSPIKHPYTDDFERFWQAYPKKTGKGEAAKVWNRNGHPGVDRILEVIAIAAQSSKWREENGRFIPNPATWLNQKRWDDDYGTGRPKEARLVL